MNADYLKFVQWSEADRLFIGYCPDLFIGGICHGSDEQKAYRKLTKLVAEETAETQGAKRLSPKRPRVKSRRSLDAALGRHVSRYS